MDDHDIVAVLVVPAEGDPGGLCHCNVLVGHGVYTTTTPAWMPAVRLPDGGDALALWWDGALVPEGWDRLQRLVRREAQPLAAHVWHPRIERVLSEAEVAVSIRLAARVIRLARVARVDGRLVEVTGG